MKGNACIWSLSVVRVVHSNCTGLRLYEWIPVPYDYSGIGYWMQYTGTDDSWIIRQLADMNGVDGNGFVMRTTSMVARPSSARSRLRSAGTARSRQARPRPRSAKTRRSISVVGPKNIDLGTVCFLKVHVGTSIPSKCSRLSQLSLLFLSMLMYMWVYMYVIYLFLSPLLCYPENAQWLWYAARPL